MQVLIAHPFSSDFRNQHQITYLPELVQDESYLRGAIREHRPNVIIIGNNTVGGETLKLWRLLMPDPIQLTLIRRGSSLTRIDLVEANALDITVLNTLSVNSKFVAEYIIKHLHLPDNGTCSTVGIIGSGAIGSRIANRLREAKHRVNIYSTSLANSNEDIRTKIRKDKGIDSSDINVAMTPEEAVLNATHVVLAFNAENVSNNKEQLSKAFVQSIPNGARIVSVTELHVFAHGALELLIQRIEQGQISARLDSHPADLNTINIYPVGLETASAAMKGPGCDEAMDQAALVVLANVALEQTLKSPLTFSTNSSEKKEEVTIIGAGIMGLVTAFFLSESGYSVTIIDEHNCPKSENGFDQNDKSFRGTTLDGCDARHASITETLPHAVSHRKDCLGKCLVKHNGWRIIPDEYNDQEKLWIDRFNELAVYPELVVNLLHKFVSNINRRGMELWEEIFRLHPQIAGETVKNRRLIRVCSSLTLLDDVSISQKKHHKSEDNLEKLTHQQVLKRIPSLAFQDGLHAGGVEVPGFAINHKQLCTNIIQYLETKQNVKFKWSTQVRSIDDITSSKIIFASSLPRLDSTLLDGVSLAIQGVVGCWTKLPNVNSIKNGFKITEKDPIGVINVTPSCDEQHLYITGGFAFWGHRETVESSHLSKLSDLFYCTIYSYLPNEFERSELENHPTKFCIRPMTPDGMPIITQLINKNGKQQIYFVGGTNAAGFVQSPLLATLILDLFKDTTSDTNLCHIYRSLRLDRNTLLFKT